MEYFSKDAVKVSAPQWLWSVFYKGCAELHTPGQKWVWNSQVQIGLMNYPRSPIPKKMIDYDHDTMLKPFWENFIWNEIFQIHIPMQVISPNILQIIVAL